LRLGETAETLRRNQSPALLAEVFNQKFANEDWIDKPGNSNRTDCENQRQNGMKPHSVRRKIEATIKQTPEARRRFIYHYVGAIVSEFQCDTS